MAFSDFQGAVVHGYAPVVQFLGCVSKAVGRLETATGTAPTISCKQVFYSSDLPTITFPDFRHKKPAAREPPKYFMNYFQCVRDSLREFQLLSAIRLRGDDLPQCRFVMEERRGVSEFFTVFRRNPRNLPKSVGRFYNSGFVPIPLTTVFGLTARVNPTGTDFA